MGGILRATGDGVDMLTTGIGKSVEDVAGGLQKFGV
jgi:hypothetical protein